MIYSSELIKGTLKTIVLKLLADNKKMYGYEITQRVKELTLDKIQITEGALYPTLHALEADGLVTTESEFIGKRVRKYYTLSPSGKNKTKEKVSELADFMETMKFLLDINTKNCLTMYRISDQQIDYILSDIGARGVEMESLQQNLLDHVCCIIENNLEENGDFESFYKKTIQTFYKDELWEIEEETLLLLTYKNYYTMKKIMINSGIAAATFFIIGSFFKFMHWPGASLLILLGMAIGALVFLPLIFLFKKNETTESKGKIVLGIGVINGILFCAYSLFKVMHWPYASTLWFFTLGIFSFVFIPLYFFNGIKMRQNYKVNTITTTLILIIVAGVFFLQTSLKKQLRNLHETEINVRIENEKIIQSDFEYVSKIIKDDSSFIKSDKRIKEIHSICEELKSELLEFDTGYKKFTPELKDKTITISGSQISSLWGGNFKEYENKISKLNNLLNEETIFELIERTKITKKDSESSSKSILFPSSILSPDPDFISYNNTIIGAYTEIQQIQLSTINNLIQLIELKEASKNNEKVNSN